MAYISKIKNECWKSEDPNIVDVPIPVLTIIHNSAILEFDRRSLFSNLAHDNFLLYLSKHPNVKWKKSTEYVAPVDPQSK